MSTHARSTLTASKLWIYASVCVFGRLACEPIRLLGAYARSFVQCKAAALRISRQPLTSQRDDKEK